MYVSKIHDAWSSRVSVRGEEFRLNELKVLTLTAEILSLPYEVLTNLHPEFRCSKANVSRVCRSLRNNSAGGSAAPATCLAAGQTLYLL